MDDNWYWDPGHMDYVKLEEVTYETYWVHKCPVINENIVTEIGLECPHCRISYNEISSPLL